MWFVEERDPSGRWFVRATLDDQQGAGHYARLYKASNLNLRFWYRCVDEEGEPFDDSEPTEV
jgi:hypothetical protein